MLTAHEIFGFMSPSLAKGIVEFIHENDRDLYRLTLNAVAEAKKVRPLFLERKSKAERNADIAGMLAKQRLDLIAANLIRGWLLKKNKAMLVSFLDALKVKHNEGAVDDLPETMDDATLQAAVSQLLSQFPAEEVAVYLNAFYAMNEIEWPNLKSMLENDSRLQLGA
jgi:hypothetical protein